MQATGESAGHLFLKNVACLWLLNQGCYLVGTEVKLNQLGLERHLELDRHTIIDALGVGLRYTKNEPIKPDGLPRGYECGYSVLRGVEVKVSRSDYRNGFVCCGCNYHYLLTPTRLLAPHEVPPGLGLIEFNKYKFRCELLNDYYETRGTKPFRIEGLRVLKRPKYREIPRFQVDHAISLILGNRVAKRAEEAFKKIQTELEGNVYSWHGEALF